MTGAKWHKVALDLKPGDFYVFFEAQYIDTKVWKRNIRPEVKYSAVIDNVKMTRGTCIGL